MVIVSIDHGTCPRCGFVTHTQGEREGDTHRVLKSICTDPKCGYRYDSKDEGEKR